MTKESTFGNAIKLTMSLRTSLQAGVAIRISSAWRTDSRTSVRTGSE